MLAERLSDAQVAAAVAALQQDEVARRPKIVGVLAVSGFAEVFCFVLELGWLPMVVIALACTCVIVLLNNHQQRFVISVAGIGLDAAQKVALKKELLRDPQVKQRIDAAAHAKAVDVAKGIARGSTRL